MLFESSSVSLDSDSGNVWWFHSEFAFPEGVEDGLGGVFNQEINHLIASSSKMPVNLTKNIVQWVPFGPLDVVHLEHCYREWQEECQQKNLSSSSFGGNRR